MDANKVIKTNILEFMALRDVTKQELAIKTGYDPALVNAMLNGEKSFSATEICHFADALDTLPHLLLVEDYFKYAVGKMEVDLNGLAEMCLANPSLRSFIVGYQAEYMARREISRQLGIKMEDFKKYDDHDRSKHGDIWFDYHGREYSVECKCLQTNYCKYDEITGSWTGKFQCDGSDACDITLDNGHTVNTVAYPFGLFDIVAVGLFAFGDRWAFAFVRSEDLVPRKYTKRSKIPEEDCPYFIQTMQNITLPLKAPYTEHILELL